jgi:hypothetical protein
MPSSYGGGIFEQMKMTISIFCGIFITIYHSFVSIKPQGHAIRGQGCCCIIPPPPASFQSLLAP